MKTIKKDELYLNLRGFLQAKGIVLQEGAYAHSIQQGCGILADTINLSQKALHRAKTEVGKRLDQMRQVIHEQTAPKPPPMRPQPGATAGPRPAKKRPATGRPAPVKARKSGPARRPRA
jgi:hypothetical protein